MTPEETIDFLREFHRRATAVTFREGGTLNKFIGDEVMVSHMLKSTEISDAGLTHQTVYEVDRSQFHRATYDRAVESLNQVNDEIESLLLKAWRR